MNFRIRKTKSSAKSSERYEVRAWDGSGDNRIEWRRRFETRIEAQNFVDEKVYEEREARREAISNGGDPLKSRTFGGEFNYWREIRSPEWSPSWRVSVNQYARDFGDKLANATISEIRPQLLKGLEAELRSRGDSAETIRHKIGMIKTVLNYSVEMERLPYNPVARYRLPKRRPADIEFWEANEVRAFLDFAQNKYPPRSAHYRNFVIYLVALNTGLRAGEIWAMRAQSLRPSLNAIQVSEQYHVVSKTFRPLKGKQGRQVPMNNQLMAILEDWIKEKNICPTGLLFTNLNGSPMDHNNFYDRVFLKDVAEWGGRKITFHGLRHTAATMMLDQGINIRTLQRILGHKDLETTERYVHTLGRTIQDAAEMFSLMPTAIQNTAPTHSPSATKSPRLM